MDNFIIYKFNILSLIDYNNNFLKNQHINYSFDISLLHLSNSTFITYTIDLINDDYHKLEKYNNDIFNISINLKNKDLLTLNSNSIITDIISLLCLVNS